MLLGVCRDSFVLWEDEGKSHWSDLKRREVTDGYQSARVRCLRRWAGKASSNKAINRFVGLELIKSETSVGRSRKGRNWPSGSGRKFAVVYEVEDE